MSRAAEVICLVKCYPGRHVQNHRESRGVGGVIAAAFPDRKNTERKIEKKSMRKRFEAQRIPSVSPACTLSSKNGCPQASRH